MTICYEHIRPKHSTDADFLGYALADYMAHTGMSERSLLGWLGIDPARMPSLTVCRSPDPTAASFRADCRTVAERFGCNAERLATMLGELAWDDDVFDLVPPAVTAVEAGGG